MKTALQWLVFGLGISLVTYASFRPAPLPGPPERCPSYPGVVVIHQITNLDAGETNCVYQQITKEKK